jgi:hypothetical protein
LELIRLMTEATTFPLHYLVWWFFFSWVIWLLLRWRNWPRPTIAIMLIYSATVGIFYANSLQRFEACIELCLPFFSVLPFIGAISFWFIVLYIPIALASKKQAISEQIRRNWWTAFLLIAFAVWHISVGLAYINGLLEISDSIASGIFSDSFFYPAMAILLPWLFWLVLPFFPWPRPTLSTMLIYSISVANVAIRLSLDALASGRYSPGFFSLSLFLSELAAWFTALYVLLKLTVRVERQVT